MSFGHSDVEILATAKADVYREMSVEWDPDIKATCAPPSHRVAHVWHGFGPTLTLIRQAVSLQ